MALRDTSPYRLEEEFFCFWNCRMPRSCANFSPAYMPSMPRSCLYPLECIGRTNVGSGRPSFVCINALYHQGSRDSSTDTQILSLDGSRGRDDRTKLCFALFLTDLGECPGYSGKTTSSKLYNIMHAPGMVASRRSRLCTSLRLDDWRGDFKNSKTSYIDIRVTYRPKSMAHL